MKKFPWSLGLLFIPVLAVTVSVFIQNKHYRPIVAAPTVVVQTPALDATNQQYIAALAVARVFGRAPGCAEADAALIGKVATEALRTGLDPRILAATVAVESSCDSMAVSRRGAVGLTQIMPRLWAKNFDFSGSVNLFNPAENLHSGSTILSGLIKQYGLTEGMRHYQGTGTDCDTCDNNYVPKILTLAGHH